MMMEDIKVILHCAFHIMSEIGEIFCMEEAWSNNYTKVPKLKYTPSISKT